MWRPEDPSTTLLLGVTGAHFALLACHPHAYFALQTRGWFFLIPFPFIHSLQVYGVTV
jgi:hypothetical protein